MCVCVCVCYLALNNSQGLICHKTQPNQTQQQTSGDKNSNENGEDIAERISTERSILLIGKLEHSCLKAFNCDLVKLLIWHPTDLSDARLVMTNM